MRLYQVRRLSDEREYFASKSKLKKFTKKPKIIKAI